MHSQCCVTITSVWFHNISPRKGTWTHEAVASHPLSPPSQALAPLSASCLPPWLGLLSKFHIKGTTPSVAFCSGFILVTSATLLGTNHLIKCFEAHLSSPFSLPFPATHLCCWHPVWFEMLGWGCHHRPPRAPGEGTPHGQPFLGLPVELGEQLITLQLSRGFSCFKIRCERPVFPSLKKCT